LACRNSTGDYGNLPVYWGFTVKLSSCKLKKEKFK